MVNGISTRDVSPMVADLRPLAWTITASQANATRKRRVKKHGLKVVMAAAAAMDAIWNFMARGMVVGDGTTAVCGGGLMVLVMVVGVIGVDEVDPKDSFEVLRCMRYCGDTNLVLSVRPSFSCSVSPSLSSPGTHSNCVGVKGDRMKEYESRLVVRSGVVVRNGLSHSGVIGEVGGVTAYLGTSQEFELTLLP